MQTWQLSEMEVAHHAPQILHSSDEGRAIVVQLDAGDKLGEHQVHERGWLVVVSGHVEIAEPDGEWASGGVGLLAEFNPNERREISATEDSRLLLILSPWPGDGHPSNRR
jgi:redox-sensitive bicupin YhaK (pirin superfamily)